VKSQPNNIAVPGLTQEQAAARLVAEGPNELPSAKPRSFLAIAWEVLSEPMILLLVAAGVIYLILGEPRDSLVLLISIFAILGIDLYQQNKTERALEALRDLSSPRALVIRDGLQTRIAGRDVARGDIVILTEGDRVPADGVVLSCLSLSVDESLLTGESVPVRKSPGDVSLSMARPGGDDLPFVYSGTLVVQGHGIAEIKATGSRTELGRVGKALQTIELEVSHLKKETKRVVGIMGALGLSICALVALIYGLSSGSWLSGILVGITVAMSLLPEEFAVVLTVFLALGAWRISRRNVLTRRASAIETLGSATVLCVDKTGTLTQNQMSVRKLLANGQFHEFDASRDSRLSSGISELLEFGILASQREGFDPMDFALQQAGKQHLETTNQLHEKWTLVREYPLSPKLLAVTRVWDSPAQDGRTVAVKGAPGAVAELCRVSPSQFEEIKNQAEAMAAEGLRILAVARAKFGNAILPEDPHEFEFKFLGMVALADPVRPEIADAVRECYSAGIRVVMITGDFAGTAQSIARQIQLQGNERALTGPDLDRLDETTLRREVSRVNIFARVVPEQKLRLIEALKANGEIVAMTGDGVNDAPALKAAHIGIAMGDRGTDVAREAADLVLLDDSFTSIVQAVRLGRRIFDNLKKAMAYVMAVHVPIAGLALIPVLLKWPLVMLPLHVVFLELVIDPACSVAFEAEPEEANVMERPPRNPKQPLFDRRTLVLSLLQGASVLLVVLGVFAAAVYRGETETNIRALTFTTLIVANLALILTNRSWTRTILNMWRSPNPAIWWVVLGAAAFLGVVLFVPSIQALFRFSRLHASDVLLCLAAGMFSIVWFEALKIVGRPRLSPALRK
jgi:Ca2+-transporting ATPase